jgi:acyl carrier protein
MDTTEIRTQIKEVIANATSIDVADIADNSSFEDDLGLDSLTLLEIAVDVDHIFKLNIPDEELSERLQHLRTVQDSVDLVVNHRSHENVGV